jgi:hypothetical protein
MGDDDQAIAELFGQWSGQDATSHQVIDRGEPALLLPVADDDGGLVPGDARDVRDDSERGLVDVDQATVGVLAWQIGAPYAESARGGGVLPGEVSRETPLGLVADGTLPNTG